MNQVLINFSWTVKLLTVCCCESSTLSAPWQTWFSSDWHHKNHIWVGLMRSIYIHKVSPPPLPSSFWSAWLNTVSTHKSLMVRKMERHSITYLCSLSVFWLKQKCPWEVFLLLIFFFFLIKQKDKQVEQKRWSNSATIEQLSLLSFRFCSQKFSKPTL